MMEYFPHGSLGDYLRPYVKAKSDMESLEALQNWRQNIQYGERESEKRIDEKVLWSLSFSSSEEKFMKEPREPSTSVWFLYWSPRFLATFRAA